MKTMIAAAAAVLASVGPASAAEVFTGAFDHAINLGIDAGDQEHGVDFEVGYRGEPSERLRRLGHPRFQVLVSKNLASETNFASAGLLWRRHLTGRLYWQAAIGLTLHDGAVRLPSGQSEQGRVQFGSRILFDPELSLGVPIGPRWAFEAVWLHLSNGHIWTSINPGMDNLGVRLVRRF